jgi:hypothetical protein
MDRNEGFDLNVFMAVPAIYNKLIDYYDKNEMDKDAV